MKAKDLSEQTFGKLTVLKLVSPTYTKAGKPVRRWLCRCECGKELIVNQNALTATKNPTRSCGCSRQNRSRDRSGERYGRLLVLRREKLPKKTANGCVNGWLCHCDCGKEVVLSTQQLRQVKSCGCLLSDVAKQKVSVDGANCFGHGNGTASTKTRAGLPPTAASSTGHRGVYWSSVEKLYKVSVQYKGKHHYIGRFRNLSEAIETRRQAEKQIFGNQKSNEIN